jgi:hypothetical protein
MSSKRRIRRRECDYHLHIVFSGTEDLLSKLFELFQAASNDFDRFRAAAEPAERRSA